jgi:succinate dehydrogenase flavin-adding protein (antitoxin of CptAB toxin-antitoxin module)
MSYWTKTLPKLTPKQKREFSKTVVGEDSDIYKYVQKRRARRAKLAREHEQRQWGKTVVRGLEKMSLERNGKKAKAK